jgi:S-formylglutathione hydrolase FrmB
MKKTAHILFMLLAGLAAKSQHHTIAVQLDTAAKMPLQGRLYIFTSTDTAKAVRDPDPFNPSPTFLADVSNWKGGETRLLDSNTAAYPIQLNRLKSGWYKFSAVLDIDTEERNNTTAVGNWYSKDVIVQVKEGNSVAVQLYLSKTIAPRPFKETGQVKSVLLKSKLVSAFRKKDSWIKAAVVLPRSYQQDSTRMYPVVFVIPGWGGTHYDVHNPNNAKRYGFTTGKEKIFVYLNPETNTPFGLHAFVDSRVNGPWGKALVQELIPYLIQNYRVTTNSNHYFIAGQSSGGYGALWLQLNYPAAFGGAWAVSPDPIDFSDFLSVNLYTKKANVYYDAEAKERPFFLINGKYQSTIKSFASLEDFLGNGGQMQSFEAEFGLPDTKTGKPRELFNRRTGAINAAVAKSWKPYDLGDYFVTHYAKIAAAIDNKIFVYAGADDNFYLNRPVEIFKQKAAKINAKATVELVPGANHWTVWTETFTAQMHKIMDEKIQ